MQQGWLMLLKKDGRVHAGNLGYDDVLDQSYTWNDTVPNHDAPKSGDGIAIWDSKVLLGASIIQEIRTSAHKVPRRRCPSCMSTNLRERTRMTPRFKCADRRCLAEFEESIDQVIEVKTFSTNHEAAWLGLGGRLDANTLRNLCDRPKTQHSIRKFKWDHFLELLDKPEADKLERTSSCLEGWRVGGHRKAVTKVRIGQGKFRKSLIDKFGHNCAFAGPTPKQALEAAHLISWSSLERHEEGGGLLLRRDLHRLFDEGLIAVNPIEQTLDLVPSIREYSQYSSLQGSRLTVSISRRELKWLKRHWDEHRETPDD
jgi:hypothetical protein